MDELRAIMRTLRDPERGCPWDLRQDFRSISPFTIEEAYEVADAIEREDLVDLRDELGDLLLQVVYHAQMAEEQQAFDLDDVIRGISAKMVRRHPHVFGERAGQMNERDVKAAWERIKSEERALKHAERKRLGQPSDAAESRIPSALDGVASTLPALVRAEKLQKRAARVGFDWPDAEPVWRCIQDELDELGDAVAAVPGGWRDSENEGGIRAASDDTSSRPMPGANAVAEELGDVLFSVVNLARHLSVDPENALRAASIKFERRFRAVERLAAERAIDLQEASLETLDALWDDAKRLG